jgi:hypothetical protein
MVMVGMMTTGMGLRRDMASRIEGGCQKEVSVVYGHGCHE